jgi:hypothetical protein
MAEVGGRGAFAGVDHGLHDPVIDVRHFQGDEVTDIGVKRCLARADLADDHVRAEACLDEAEDVIVRHHVLGYCGGEEEGEEDSYHCRPQGISS